MNDKTLNPTTLFGKNGAGTPWEDATGAKNRYREDREAVLLHLDAKSTRDYFFRARCALFL